MVLRQPFGTDYATEPMEVEKTSGSYPGNWNHNEFRDAVEDYYRDALTRMMRIGQGSSVRMRNNAIEFPKSYEIDIPE